YVAQVAQFLDDREQATGILWRVAGERRGGGGESDDGQVCGPALPRRPYKPFGLGTRVLLTAGDADGQLDRAHLAQRVRIAARLGQSCEPSSPRERLLDAAELQQKTRTVGLAERGGLAEAALPTEVDCLLESGERAARSLERIAGDREVVLEDRGVAAGALVDEQVQGPLH